MSMMCPPHRVKITSTPSAFNALATRWPPEILSGFRRLGSGLPGSALVATAASDIEFPPSGMVPELLRPQRRIGGDGPQSRQVLIQIGAMTIDMGCEVERVLAGQPLGKL